MNFSEVLNTSYRALISLAVLFLVTKMIGKKQVSELSLFDYVIGISIGNFAAEMTINLESQEINGIVAVLIFGIVAYIVSYITMKSIYLRRFFIGVPTIIIDKGKINYKNMKKFKMDINDLLEQARINGYFDLSEIEFAILEANGKISFLPKGEYKNITVKDMKLKIEKQGLCANVIIDGNIMDDNLINIGKDTEWLLHELKCKGKKVHDILLATVDINDKLTLYERLPYMDSNKILE